MEKEFINFVATVLNVNSESLSLRSGYDGKVWDSLMHIRLAVAINDRYGNKIPFEEVGRIRCLGDFYNYIKD